MGYFPNGTAGDMYEEQYCNRCVHQNGPDGKSGCAIWFAHMLHNYKECNNKQSILHMLIPRNGVENDQCELFMEKKKAPQADEGDTLFPREPR